MLRAVIKGSSDKKSGLHRCKPLVLVVRVGLEPTTPGL